MRSTVLVTLLGAGLLSAAIATTLTLVLSAESAPEPMTDTVSRADWESLRDELERTKRSLERHSNNPGSTASPRAADTGSRAEAVTPEPEAKAEADSTSLAALRKKVQGQDERIRRLENDIRALERRALSVEAVPDSIEAIREALKDKNLYGYQVSNELRNRRMELLERFLALAPTDPKADQHFRRLFNDYLGTRQFQRGEALLERMRGPLDLSAWDLNRRRASLASMRGKRDLERQLLHQTASDPSAPEQQRASARFSIAHSYQQAGDYARAIPLYQALIRSYPDPPPASVKSSVGGAKAMIERIRRWQEHAKKNAGK